MTPHELDLAAAATRIPVFVLNAVARDRAALSRSAALRLDLHLQSLGENALKGAFDVRGLSAIPR